MHLPPHIQRNIMIIALRAAKYTVKSPVRVDAPVDVFGCVKGFGEFRVELVGLMLRNYVGVFAFVCGAGFGGRGDEVRWDVWRGGYFGNEFCHGHFDFELDHVGERVEL